jgi:hypothetical protein
MDTLHRYASAIDNPSGQACLRQLLRPDAKLRIVTASGLTLFDLAGRDEILDHFFVGRDASATPRRHYVYTPHVTSLGRKVGGSAPFVSVEHSDLGPPTILAGGTYEALLCRAPRGYQLERLTIQVLGESVPVRSGMGDGACQ